MSGPRRSGGRRPARPVVVADNSNGYVETDPTGRYGRFDELLGRGAMKSVYRGFDEELGVEVAWNQVSLCDVLRTPEAVQRMYSEVQLLRTLRHDAVIAFHASWVDARRRSFNFITELFSSGTLRSYRLRYPRVSLRAVRSWARQILRGLAYLHARGVIHRDLKCDNVLVNGHVGQVKIADLGLAAVLRDAEKHAHSVIGTPEFMAPEMYDEDYDELVDVYSFGMCVLEMLTLEFPYAECTNPAQIYKKVTAGKLPDAFFRVRDDDARRFIGRCLVNASKRPSAAELLLDPFLVLDDHNDATSSLPSSPRPLPPRMTDDDDDHHQDDGIEEEPAVRTTTTDMTITGKLNAEEDTVFLKVQMVADDGTGHVRNIYFPFDLASDTTVEVATEMVKELEIADRGASEIAAMIEQEIDRLLPGGGGGGRGEQQHEYSYHDSEEQPPPPFYYLSSSPATSPSSAGGGGFFSGPHGGACWSKDHYYSYSYASSDDDDTSSLHSGKYSALHYDTTSGHDEAPEEEEGRPADGSSRATTRFGPGERSPLRRAEQEPAAHPHQRRDHRHCSSMSPPDQQHAGRPRQRDDEDDRRRRRTTNRNRSMVDMRSQLLHRTLVEELNRRLFFNTVGAVENIGFRAPPGYGPGSGSGTSSSAASSRGGRGRVDHHRGGGSGRRSKEDDSSQRYYML